MNRFMSLLHREWMQHHRGWLILMALPLVLTLVVGLFAELRVNVGGHVATPGALVIAVACIAGLAALTFAVSWGAALLQAPGLARRDVQDRSIEFWLSLPVSHLQSLGATLLTHLVLVPWAALAAGLAGGTVASLLLVSKGVGLDAWIGLPWQVIAPAAIAIVLRLALGVLLATLWLSPLILGTMAASAWLKRWGVPVVVGVLAVGGQVLDKFYGISAVWDVLGFISERASQAFIHLEPGHQVENAEQFGAMLAMLPSWLAQDAGNALAQLASPGFLAVLAAGAAAFALLVLRRRRGG